MKTAILGRGRSPISLLEQFVSCFLVIKGPQGFDEFRHLKHRFILGKTAQTEGSVFLFEGETK